MQVPENKNIFLIWQERLQNPRFFLLPEESLNLDEKNILVSLANKFLTEDSPDEEYELLWNIKAAVSSSEMYIPKFVPEFWLNRFVNYEVPGPVLNGSVSDIISIGTSVSN